MRLRAHFLHLFVKRCGLTPLSELGIAHSVSVI